MHYVFIEDERGELVKAVPACSAGCAEGYCERHGIEYAGWNGAHEGADYPEYCGYCGVRCSVGLESECGYQCLPYYAWYSPAKECAHGWAYWVNVEEGE